MLGSNKIGKRFTWIEINLENLSYNLSQFKLLLKNKDTKIMAVVKANAYGHGAVEISKRALKDGAYCLGVALVEEGVELRKAGIGAPICILGEIPGPAIKDAVKYDLAPSISSARKAKTISKISKSLGKTANCHINIDTGMNRLGINFRDCARQIKKILELDYISIEGIFTHFSCASEKGDRFTEIQWKRFWEVLKEIRELKKEIKFFHCCNSAAFLKYRKMEMYMVRLGIAIYGLNPFSGSSSKLDLKPVLSLKSRITFIKKVAPGEGISYCSTFKTKRESIIATIPIGYADGYSRILSNKASAIINGQFAPLVGNITMDQIMIDLTDIEGADRIKAGHEVILLGSSGDKRISAENLAELAGTINYEIVCNFRSRIPRIFIN